MSVHKRSSAIVVARHCRQYKAGERVKILRGKYAGQEMTVHQSANDWVMLKEAPRREIMSKGNLEPVEGFSEDEMNQARRAAERMQGLGSLL